MRYYITTMSKEYFDALGFKSLQSWLKNCQSGEIILYAENFEPDWNKKHNLTNWSDEYYNRLKIVNLTLDEKWNNLRNSLTGRAKNFIWKAAAWEAAVTNLKGTVTFFDADLICFQDPAVIIDEFESRGYDASIISVKDVRPHADSCFYSINTTNSNCKKIIEEYNNQYQIASKHHILYPKPYDAPVYAHALDKLKNEISVWDFNAVGHDAKSPLKTTVLVSYFRHLKGNQKDSGRILGLIDKTINALDKGKSNHDILTRFDRKLRHDDTKKLDLPF
jgi:hypothetical protein